MFSCSGTPSLVARRQTKLSPFIAGYFRYGQGLLAMLSFNDFSVFRADDWQSVDDKNPGGR